MVRKLMRAIRSGLRRLLRRRVSAGNRRRGDGGGAAGVREPRRPLPHGPLANAAAAPLPEEHAGAVVSNSSEA